MIRFKGIRKLLVLYCLLTLFPILPTEAAYAVTGEAEAIDGEVIIREYGASAKATFPLSGGIEYRLTFSFCAFGEGETVDMDAEPAVWVDAYERKYPFANTSFTKREAGTDGFRQYFVDIRTEKEILLSEAAVTFYGRQNMGSRYVYKNISLLPVNMTVKTDEMFYYTDRTTGIATAKVPEAYNGKMVTFCVHRNGNETASGKGTVIGGKATWQFSVPAAIPDIKNAYVLTANLETVTAETEVHRYPRPENLSKDGVYTCDGKPFYPRIAYSVYEDGGMFHYSKVGEMGFNTVMAPTAHETILGALLAMAEENGIKLIPQLYGGLPLLSAGTAARVENTKRIVEKYKDHPAVLAWAIMDEPFYNQIDPAPALAKAYRTIRDIDSMHPVYMVVAQSDYYEEGQKYTDILAVDPYPIRKAYGKPVDRAAHKAAETVEKAKTATQKPVYAILQCFETRNNPSNPHGANFFLPTIDEIRNMTYSVMLAGAAGFGCYKLGNAVYDVETESFISMWDTSLGTELTRFLRLEGEDIFTWLPRADVKKEEKVWTATWEKGNFLYVMTLNRTQSEAFVSVPTEKAGAPCTLVSGTKPFMHDGTVSVTLPPNGVMLCRVGEGIAVLEEDGEMATTLEAAHSVVNTISDDGGILFAARYAENTARTLVDFHAIVGSGEIPAGTGGASFAAWYWKKGLSPIEYIKLSKPADTYARNFIINGEMKNVYQNMPDGYFLEQGTAEAKDGALMLSEDGSRVYSIPSIQSGTQEYDYILTGLVKMDGEGTATVSLLRESASGYIQFPGGSAIQVTDTGSEYKRVSVRCTKTWVGSVRVVCSLSGTGMAYFDNLTLYADK